MTRHFIALTLTFLAGCAPEADPGADSGAAEVDSAADEAALDSVEPSYRGAGPLYHMPVHSGERYRATTYSGHGNAWDLNKTGDCGEPVVAVADGRVVQAQRGAGAWGNTVRLDHDGDAYFSRYAHLTDLFVTQGQWVQRGQTLGTIGQTGRADGCHLHFQVETSGGGTVSSRFRYYDGGDRTGSFAHGVSYTSINHGKMDAKRTALGASRVGNATTPTASRVDDEGFAMYYRGGTWGDNATYYHALGHGGWSGCSGCNNTNYAFNVRHGFYSAYHSCGGPRSCWLGFPTGEEYGTGYGSRQNFQHGCLRWERTNGGINGYPYTDARCR